jgi:hypothetical protein
VGDECVRSLGEEDPDAIIEGLMKIRAKEEAFGDVPSHVGVVRYLIQVPYLHVITNSLLAQNRDAQSRWQTSGC